MIRWHSLPLTLQLPAKIIRVAFVVGKRLLLEKFIIINLTAQDPFINLLAKIWAIPRAESLNVAFTQSLCGTRWRASQLTPLARYHQYMGVLPLTFLPPQALLGALVLRAESTDQTKLLSSP